MGPLAITTMVLACSFVSYTWGNLRGFEEQERNEQKAKAFWKEVNKRGI
jgi:hypothetical protein